MVREGHQGLYLITTDKASLDLGDDPWLLEDLLLDRGHTRAGDKALGGKLADLRLVRGRKRGRLRPVGGYATFNYLADVFVLEPHRG